MTDVALSAVRTYRERLDALRETKIAHTREKQALIGSMNHDDHALILPPPEVRKVVQTISGSGMPVTDVLLDGFEPVSNHPSGGTFGAKAVGTEFGALLRTHPPYVDPMSGLLGGYCVNYGSYCKMHWPPELDYGHLRPDQERYGLVTGIGAWQHFCQDLSIGLELGFGGLLEKIRSCRGRNRADHDDFYQGLEAVVAGLQSWVARSAQEARRLADAEADPHLRQHLVELAEMNEDLVCGAPRSFREACQWIGWYDMAARMFNGSGSLGRLDVLLFPFYKHDVGRGELDDEEAIYYLASLLLMDTAYIQLGGPDTDGSDATNRVSFLVLEAAHRLRVPANIAVCVGQGTDPALLRRGVEILLEDKTGIPKFLGIDNVVAGFTRNGYRETLARQRAYAGCHWFALPGREYTLNDCVKLNFAAVLQVAWEDMFAQPLPAPSVARLWALFARHLRKAVAVLAEGLDFHMAHMHEVRPELVLDLLCHGTIEQGLDASHGGVEYVNLCVDGAALATVADSFAALEQRVEGEARLTWEEVRQHIASDWAGPQGERARLMMKSTPRYGGGGTAGDRYAQRIAQLFTELVKEKPTPAGHNMIPGLFSWANTVSMGRGLKATPNGRHAGQPISHGANPDPGFRRDGAPTAMAVAIASVQPGYGNSAPMQIEFDPGLTSDAQAVDTVVDLVQTHMALGGTQINMNILDTERVLAAHANPELYPDLVVRVTGFSAYFASLSAEFRQLVVDRIIAQS
jgi:formate C-acetyltransferase